MGTSIERERGVMGWKKRERETRGGVLKCQLFSQDRIKVKRNSSAHCGD